MKHRWLVGILASTLVAGPVAAQTQRQGAAQTKGEVPTAATSLGSVTIPRAVTANGKPLPRGTYQVRLTAESPEPVTKGGAADQYRWVEFVQGGQVKGREVANIIPNADLGTLMTGPDREGPRVTNGAKVELLKGDDFVRVWINRGGVNYLIHLPTVATT